VAGDVDQVALVDWHCEINAAVMEYAKILRKVL
jgi:hypothetical protein